MVHDTSVEERRYLSSVRYETEAFDALVRAKQHMAMPAEMEGRLGDGAGLVAADASDRTRAHGRHDPPALPLPQLANRAEATARERGALVDTRRRGGQLSTPTRLHVVVDVREFMSSLPSILHQSGFKLMPVTLEVGDYVLSPDICVERKSVPDLIGSLQSGRLYNQAEAMSKHYKMPVLLIEFERDKAFALQSLGDMSGDIALTSLQSKLCLLVLAFPKLRIMWSRSLHATAEMFAAFKIAEPEPAPEVAAAVGVPNGGDATGAGGRDEDPFNRAAIDFVRRLPGVTDANYRRVMDAVERPADLAEMSEEDLRIILGDQRQAKTLREFLHAPFPN
jgi:DNA excision repair protein ERCC-4